MWRTNAPSFAASADDTAYAIQSPCLFHSYSLTSGTLTSSPVTRLRMIRSAPGSLRFSRDAFCRPSAGCAAPAPRPAAAASAATAAAAEALVIREPYRRGLRKAEAADLLERLHLSVRQRHDAEPGARLARAAVAAAAASLSALCGLGAGLRVGAGVRVRRVLALFFRLRLRDGEDDELRVGREGRRGAARVFEFLAGAQVADDELAVVPLRR